MHTEHSFNVSGVTDNGAGEYTVAWDRDFTSADYVVAGSAEYNGSAYSKICTGSQANGSVKIYSNNSGGGNEDMPSIHVMAIGDFER